MPLNPFTALSSLFGKVLDTISPDKSATREAQARLNEAEIQGAPPSRLRLWRSFLGWTLAVLFVWEVVVRTAILTYWPDTLLPPSVLREITTLLVGMLGLGF